MLYQLIKVYKNVNDLEQEINKIFQEVGLLKDNLYDKNFQ